MKANPILQEVWNIKDRLAAEAGYDIHRFCEQLREWSKAHPDLVPPVNSFRELEKDGAAPLLREEPPT